MIKHFAMAVAAAALLSGSALAQSPSALENNFSQPRPTISTATPSGGAVTTTGAPGAGQQVTTAAGAVIEVTEAKNPTECRKTAADLARDAQERAIADDKLEKIDDLILSLEKHCDASRFGDALAVAKTIKGLIETP